MWSYGEKPILRTNLRKRGSQSSTSSQRRLPPKSDPFQKCSMCSNDITGFLQRSETTSAHSVVLSCAHVVCDECFKKLGLTSFQAEKRGYVKCVLCRSTVTFAILPTLDDVGPSTSCNSCAQAAGYECKQCCMKWVFHFFSVFEPNTHQDSFFRVFVFLPFAFSYPAHYMDRLEIGKPMGAKCSRPWQSYDRLYTWRKPMSKRRGRRSARSMAYTRTQCA
ncbi:unnamed protein product [Haemonchus placei]|uniref:RING-type domain-containing protein n=1 Tax=Haemonchus placei TaxID=6290 RepID=A0A0N4WXW1_HAEPC|nr:unnamed protein product [Haemonchus placei]